MSEDRWVEALPVRAIDVIAPFSPYVETYWLPTVGPSCVWLYRRFVQWLAAEPDGLTVDIEEVGRMVGLHGGTGKQAVVQRTLKRLDQFNLVDVEGWKIGVHVMLPPISERQVLHLPERLQRTHTAPAVCPTVTPL